MRAADAPVTVGIVSGDDLASRPPRAPLAARLSESQWLAASTLIMCAALAVFATAIGPFPHERAPRFFLAVVACGPIIWLRRWPLPVLAVAVAATELVMVSGAVSLPLMFLLGLAVYFAASRLPRRLSIGVALAGVAALGLAFGYAALMTRGASVPVQAAAGFAPPVAAWFVGDAVAARRRYQAGLAEQAEREAKREQAAEAERARQKVREERMRIAHELHDVVAHTLAVITVQAGVGRRLMARRPEEASAALESIETIGRTAQDELRVVLGLLRDEEIGAAALAPAPRLTDLKELADNVRASGTPVELGTSGTDRALSVALELSLYRVVQEALTNVVKHAPGARASVDLAVSADRVRLEVADDGGPDRRAPGAGEGAPGAGTGHGIVGMRERVGAFGGWLVAEPLADRGFHVLAEIPVEGAV